MSFRCPVLFIVHLLGPIRIIIIWWLYFKYYSEDTCPAPSLPSGPAYWGQAPVGGWHQHQPAGQPGPNRSPRGVPEEGCGPDEAASQTPGWPRYCGPWLELSHSYCLCYGWVFLAITWDRWRSYINSYIIYTVHCIYYIALSILRSCNLHFNSKQYAHSISTV